MSDEDDLLDAGDDWAAALAEQAESESADQAETANLPKAEFEELGADSSTPGDETKNLEVILDIPVSIALEVGRTKISIRNLLQLNQGSIIELDRLAGEPLDVLVNGTLIAHGEVVVVNDKFGVRLTDIISKSERIKRLR